MSSQTPEPLAGNIQETDFEPEEPRGTALADGDDEDSQQPLLGRESSFGTRYGAVSEINPIIPPKPPSNSARALAPDLLRGLLMIFMAIDHVNVILRTYPHGTGGHEEFDSTPVRGWSPPLGYAIRSLTHLCATGFIFLLGLGVVYLGTSRTKLGWSSGRLAKHFLLRGVALALVGELWGLVATGAQAYIANLILFALAVDYPLAGLVWLAMRPTERVLARALVRVIPEKKDEGVVIEEPLLENQGIEILRASDRALKTAADMSWHIHNVALLVLAVVTIWWNLWLSPNGGHCRAEVGTAAPLPNSLFIRFWFYPSFTARVIDAFPPLAWISFAFLGLLYGRILLARPWKPVWIAAGNTMAALGFLVIFILTRVLHFGNLSEDCLDTPDQTEGKNSYLASPQAFFYITKYPPDVAFWAYTMFGNLLLLAVFGIIPPSISRRFTVLLTYGTSALFFYVTHIIPIFLFGALLVKLLGQEPDPSDPRAGEPDGGIVVRELWAYFGLWLFTLAMMYPLCRWYGGFKRTKGPDSIWRFF